MAKIIITSTRWGHTSIAKAIKEILDNKNDVELICIEAEPFSKISYHLIYKFFPGLFKVVFRLSGMKFFRSLFNSFVAVSYQSVLERVIKRQKPDIVINVYFAFDSSLAPLQERYRFKLINVLADPWTFSKILISTAGENLTFDNYSLKRLKELEPKASGQPIGWFIEKKYYDVEKLDQNKVRKDLGLDPDMFTLCVVSGSEGTFNIFKILSTLTNPKLKMQVIILCGNNHAMFNVVRALRSLSGKINGPKIKGIPYTESMQLYLKAADLVVGKAGPNTLFQSVIVGSPFFAISHISGQEDGNLDIIKRYKIGFVEENPNKAAKKLKEVIRNPKTLSKFRKNLKQLSKYCLGSKDKLLNSLNG